MKDLRRLRPSGTHCARGGMDCLQIIDKKSNLHASEISLFCLFFFSIQVLALQVIAFYDVKPNTEHMCLLFWKTENFHGYCGRDVWRD